MGGEKERKKERKDSLDRSSIPFAIFQALISSLISSFSSSSRKRSLDYDYYREAKRRISRLFLSRGMRPRPFPRAPLPSFVPSHPSCFWIHGRKSFLSHDTGVGNPPGGQAYPIPATKLPRTQIKSEDVRRRECATTRKSAVQLRTIASLHISFR